MSDFRSETSYAAIAQVEAYWEAVRGARLLPKRSDIDPRGIEQCLEYAFILERVATGVARLRIAGTHLNELMGMEVRGLPLTTFFSPAARAVVGEQLEVVFQKPAICTLNLSSPAGPGRPALQARLILLPLRSDLGDVSRVLGCIVSKGEIGKSPRRFDVVSKHVLSILAGETPQPEDEPKSPPPRIDVTTDPATPGMQEAPEPFLPQSGKKLPPYLRLVKSDNKPT